MKSQKSETLILTSSKRLTQISSNCTVTYLILYAVIGATYLCFFQTYVGIFPPCKLCHGLYNSSHRLENFKTSEIISEAQAASYDRNHPRYPYKSHGQWLKACYGMCACLILLTFNGINSFLEEPFDGTGFVVSYIGVSLFPSRSLPSDRSVNSNADYANRSPYLSCLL